MQKVVDIIDAEAEKYFEHIVQYKLSNDFQLLDIVKSEIGNVRVKAEILYRKNHLHIIKLVKRQEEFYWELFPYNGDVYFSVAFHPDTFEVILQAIEEHCDIHLKRLYS